MLVAVFVCATLGRARADEPPWYKGVSPETRTKVTKLFDQGNKFFEQNDYTKAAEIYFEAVEAWNHPGIQFNLAVSLMNLDRTLEAYEHLKAALAFGPSGLEKQRYQEAQTYQKLLEGRLVRFSITVAQDQVEVRLDGKLIQTGKGRVDSIVLPGAHALVATRRGYETLTKNLTFIGGSPYVDTVSLAPKIVLARRYRTWMPWTVVSVGGAVAIGGALTVLAAHVNESRFEDQFAAACPLGCALNDPTKNVQWSLRDRARIENIIGWSAVGAGGAVALIGLVLVARNQPREVPFPGTAVVTATSDHFGIAWAGRF